MHPESRKRKNFIMRKIEEVQNEINQLENISVFYEYT
jgi:hypothetical protein